MAITHLKSRCHNEVIAVGNKKTGNKQCEVVKLWVRPTKKHTSFISFFAFYPLVSLWSFKRKMPHVRELEAMPEHCGEIVRIDVMNGHEILAVTNLGYRLVWLNSNDCKSNQST